jgi:hypothetical protein
VSAGWTDETHTLYISSMETSFMDQLYNHGSKSNHKDPSGDGFKVLRGGVWEKHKFERTNACAPVSSKCRLPASPWIRHFRPREYSGNTGGHGEEISVGDHESGIRTVHGRTSLSHGRELGACMAPNLLAENAGSCSTQLPHSVSRALKCTHMFPLALTDSFRKICINNEKTHCA